MKTFRIFFMQIPYHNVSTCARLSAIVVWISKTIFKRTCLCFDFRGEYVRVWIEKIKLDSSTCYLLTYYKKKATWIRLGRLRATVNVKRRATIFFTLTLYSVIYVLYVCRMNCAYYILIFETWWPKEKCAYPGHIENHYTSVRQFKTKIIDRVVKLLEWL